MSTASQRQDATAPPRSPYGSGARPNRLDLHRIGGHYIGLFREPFDRIIPLAGIRLRPDSPDLSIWAFTDPENGMKGRMIDVSAYLQDAPLRFEANGLAYLARDRGRLLALYLPPHPRRIKLTETNFKIVEPKEGQQLFPANWPKGLVVRVIRSWLYRVAIVDEKYLLGRLLL